MTWLRPSPTTTKLILLITKILINDWSVSTVRFCYEFPGLQKPFWSLCVLIHFYQFISVYVKKREARAHSSWCHHRCCETVQGRKKERKQKHLPKLQHHVHILIQKRNQFPSSSVRAFKRAASWQRPVGRFNPSRRPPTSDLTHAVVKRSIAAWFSINSGQICPSKKERKNNK